jgi:hypothetical protein
MITDRGIVNIRTGSFNLGCQPADQLKLSNDELTDSNEFFSRLNDSQNEFIRSSSNYSFRTAYNNNSTNTSSDYFKSSFGSKGGDSFGGASNLIVPLQLIYNRRKNSTVSINSKGGGGGDETPQKPSIQLSPSDLELINSSANAPPPSQSSTLGNKPSLNLNSTSINNGLLPTPNLPGEQERRCSHDPNIEKLHKTYINNVKLGGTAVVSSASVSTTNTDSTSNILNSALANCDSPPASKLTSIRYTLNHIKKSKNSSNNSSSSGSKSNRNYIKLSSSTMSAAKNAAKNQSLTSSDPIDADKLELESSEKSDVLNEINKVNKWLRDTKNHHSKSPSAAAKEHKKMGKLPPSMTISEDEDNYASLSCATSHVDAISANKIAGLISYSYDDEDNETEAKTKHSHETTDSAIDIRSYGSISTLSRKTSSSANSRVNWQSFSKYYRLQFYQQMDTTWTKYQISAMSLEQLMALRKLALIQFSKLVERQHSTMIRKFRLFTKKTSTAASAFQKAYDSIDSINASKPSAAGSSRSENASSSGLSASASGKNGEHAAADPQASVIIGNRKISHQLGAHIGMHPNVASRKRRKTSLKKLEKQLYYESKRDTPMAISVDESSSEIRDTSEMSVANSTYAVSNPNSSANGNPNAGIGGEHAKPKISTSVFALPLSKIMQHTGQPLPQRIIEAMRLLRRIAPNEVGVFRKNGNKARINKLKESINKNEPINFQSEDITVFDIADTIKLYFRELPECLITNKLSDILLSNYTSMALAYFFFLFLLWWIFLYCSLKFDIIIKDVHFL